MKTRFACWLGAVALAFASFAAHAAISCSVSSAGFSTGYDPAYGGTDITQTFFTVTCTRGLTSDPASVTYNAFANNGLNATGSNNRAARGASRLSYDIYRDAGCSSQWQGLTSIAGTINFSGTGTVSQTAPFWGCIPSGQAVPAGTYTDTVTITILYSGFTIDTGTFGVSVLTPATCALTTPPGTIVFNYVAFGGAIAPTTTYRVTCTSTFPYSMALDATSGTALGLSYTLALGTSSSAGTGAAQTFTINGAMAGGQAGTCASGTCTSTTSRTLTISY